jgi:Mg2+ and Co2+ transporter CorA
VVETYQVDYTTLVTKLAYLLQEIDNVESMMSLKLDTARNQLLITDMTLATVSLTISIANFIIGIFGMNLYSALESVSARFFWSLAILMIVAIIWGSRQLLVFFNLVDPSTKSLHAFKEHRP